MQHTKILFTLFLLSFCISTYGQCDKTAAACEVLLGKQFLSDGQEYRALLNGNETAEFRNTFYGGNTYRIICGSGPSTGHLQVRIYDQARNVLYNSGDFSHPASWDFKFTGTLNCTIEAQLIPSADGQAPSGCAVLLIGFKQ